MTGPETHRRPYPASGQGAHPMSVETIHNRIRAACKEARTESASQRCSSGFQPCPRSMEPSTMAKDHVLRRVEVLFPSCGWQEKSLMTTGRAAC